MLRRSYRSEAGCKHVLRPAARGPGAHPAPSPYHCPMTPPQVKPATGSSRYLNRELSMLDFQARVLALAEDASVPLLERAKFIAIFSSNIDEFFQVRVSGLKEQ